MFLSSYLNEIATGKTDDFSERTMAPWESMEPEPEPDVFSKKSDNKIVVQTPQSSHTAIHTLP